MATYKKRGNKNTKKSTRGANPHPESTTAEVFEALDKNAFRLEDWVQKHHKAILGTITALVMTGVGYFLYQNFSIAPHEEEAEKEIYFAHQLFQEAIENKNATSKDSLYNVALNGDGNHYGLLDIIDNYSGTHAANRALYSAGISYLNTGDYDHAIEYLSLFSSEDPILMPLAIGAIGDAQSAKGDEDQALASYKKALAFSDNALTAPRFLMKAGLAAIRLDRHEEASGYFQKIKDLYAESTESRQVAPLLAKTKHNR